YAEVAGSVVRPVAFSVAIILLVYLPLLSLQGVEGKMFRPMAVTMACALFGAVVYALLFFPALCVLLVPPPVTARHWAWEMLVRRYLALLPRAMRDMRWSMAGAAALLVGVLWLQGKN